MALVPESEAVANFKQVAPSYMKLLMNDFNLSLEEAAAVFGNLGHESWGLTASQEVKPLGGGRGGLGWAQWTGPRRRAFESYAKRNGLSVQADTTNYAFLFNELKGSHASSLRALLAAQGLREKVIAFEKSFERAHKDHKHYDRRLKWARLAIDAYNASKGIDEPINVPNIPTDLPKDTYVMPGWILAFGLGAAAGIWFGGETSIGQELSAVIAAGIGAAAAAVLKIVKDMR